MDPTISVSKGCFVFKGVAAGKSAVKRKLKEDNATALRSQMTSQPFYTTYADTWQKLESHIEQLQSKSYTKTLEDVVKYIQKECSTDGAMDTYDMEEIVPAAALLTGVNQPDHLEQFATLSQRLLQKMSASVCMLQSRDCSTLKSAVEAMVYNFIETAERSTSQTKLADEDVDRRERKRLRRTQCNMRHLLQWYRRKYGKRGLPEEMQVDDSNDEHFEEIILSEKHPAEWSHALIVVLPDFECFNASILQDFILMLSAYRTHLPFVLIFGVATAVSAIHNALPYHVTSKVKLCVFKTQTAPVCLNEILEHVILSPRYAFHLSGKAFKFLTHIFLYYDFSIHGFIQGYKYCLMEHFLQGNAYALCSNYSTSLNQIKALSHDDVESIRRLLSFRPYVEGINDCKRIIAILTDDNYLKKKLPQLLRDCHIHFMILRIFLEFLAVLVGDLPKCPLGKQRRELYAVCLSKELCEQPEFKECWQLLGFMSKDEFVAKISKATSVTEDFMRTEITSLELANDCMTTVNAKLQDVKNNLSKVVMAGMEEKSPTNAAASNNYSSTPSTPDANKQKFTSRQDLKEHLLQKSKQQNKSTSEFAQAVAQTLLYIKNEIIVPHLAPLTRAPPLHELFVFSDLSTVRRNIIGAPRAALHMALNNPNYYLQCKCCQLSESTQLLATLPDLSVAYRLHLECGRMINLFDWLQAFRSVVDDIENEREQVDPQIQARFTRAVAELQFLGYIKMSKRKTDHATRLTW
ncbi:PREDICTED: origin recognition complex subunit 3 [Rhagoletis zephyria]|uniref:origin recognition complex subunit 3 n=1 Tax=Rhagoletis zephyria TaxID=28612 RepID=UPI000811853A|nr:PREDICTED: origin recognition complex subunit 3 [Rhagoletis zephyria]